MVQEFKEIYKKKEGKELGDQEAYEAAQNLINYVELCMKVAQRVVKLERRLRKEPDGFPVEGTYSCLICHQSITSLNGWYHWGGQRCLTCHKAIKDGIVPSYIVKGRDSYYSMWQMKDKFDLHPQTARKLVRTGQLKARIILDENGKPHEYIFLKKENPELIDPDRHSPARKSYDRNREKVNARAARKHAQEMRAEWEKTKKKWTLKK